MLFHNHAHRNSSDSSEVKIWPFWLTLTPDLEMKVWTCRPARHARKCDFLRLRDFITIFYQELAQVAVQCAISVAMLHNDGLTITLLGPGKNHGPLRRGNDFRANAACNINPLVELMLLSERIFAYAKARRNTPLDRMDKCLEVEKVLLGFIKMQTGNKVEILLARYYNEVIRTARKFACNSISIPINRNTAHIR